MHRPCSLCEENRLTRSSTPLWPWLRINYIRHELGEQHVQGVAPESW
jgi:hypothetical protein